MKRFPLLRIGVVFSCFVLFTLPVYADYSSTDKAFNAAKSSEPELIAFLTRMPKGGDLHMHLSGAVNTEALLDTALSKGLFYDAADNRFYKDQVKKDDGKSRIEPSNLPYNNSAMSAFLDHASMRGYMPGSESGHDHFFNAFDYIGSVLGNVDDDPKILMMDNVVSSAMQDNVQYLELMTGVTGSAQLPTLPGDAFDQLEKPGTNIDDIVRSHLAIQDKADRDTEREAILKNVNVQVLEDALKTLTPGMPSYINASNLYMNLLDSHFQQKFQNEKLASGASDKINIRYIVSVTRNSSLTDFFRNIAGALAIMKAEPNRVVALNILSPEDYLTSRNDFAKQMVIIDFLRKYYPEGHITLHAGELTPTISPIDVMRWRIRASIEVGRAERIGHGVSIAWEDHLNGLLTEMKDGTKDKAQPIAVEICLTSNDAILGVKGDRHPWNLYRKAGVPLCICTDDEGVSRSNLTLEYVRAVRAYDLSYADLKSLVRSSIEYSFLPGTGIYKRGDNGIVRGLIVDPSIRFYEPDPVDWEKVLKTYTSDKAQKEVVLEEAFDEFEKGF